MITLSVKMYIYGLQEKESLEEYQGLLYIKHPAWHSAKSWVSYIYEYKIENGKLLPGFQSDTIGNYGNHYFIGDTDPKVGDIFQVGVPDHNFKIHIYYFRITDVGDMMNYPYITMKKIELAKPSNSWGKINSF